MENSLFKSKAILYVSIILLAGLFSSCAKNTRIFKERDYALKSKRMFFTHQVRDNKWRSPLFHLNQTILKESYPNGTASYLMFDNLMLRANSADVQNTAYLIIDGQAFQTNITAFQYNHLQRSFENVSHIPITENVSFPVVTGYNTQFRKVVSFNYGLTPEMVASISNARTVRYQYYVGHNIVSVKMRPGSLRKLKRLIKK